MLRARHTLVACLLVSLGLATGGCDKLTGGDGDKSDADKSDDDKDDADDKDGGDEAGKSDDEKSEKKKKKDDEDEDDGSIKLLLGDDKDEWVGDYASARVRDDNKLSITGSVKHDDGQEQHKRRLSLSIKDYKGVGSYELNNMNSNLTGVKFNVKGVQKAEEEGDKKKLDEEATKATKDAIRGASVTLLRGAKIEITKADSEFIDGTIEWSGQVGLRGTNKISGEFHARVKEAKKRKKRY